MCRSPPQDAFPGFFKRVLTLKEGREDQLRMHERTAYLLFTIRAFQVGPSLDYDRGAQVLVRCQTDTHGNRSSSCPPMLSVCSCPLPQAPTPVPATCPMPLLTPSAADAPWPHRTPPLLLVSGGRDDPCSPALL